MSNHSLPPSYEVLVEHYKVLSRRLMKAVRKPDEDVTPVLLFDADEGTNTVFVPALTAGQVAKEAFYPFYLPELLRRENARVCGLLVPCWGVQARSAEEVRALEQGVLHPSTHPDHQELVSLFTSDGTRAFSSQSLGVVAVHEVVAAPELLRIPHPLPLPARGWRARLHDPGQARHTIASRDLDRGLRVAWQAQLRATRREAQL
jgi:hypothetical protein